MQPYGYGKLNKHAVHQLGIFQSPSMKSRVGHLTGPSLQFNICVHTGSVTRSSRASQTKTTNIANQMSTMEIMQPPPPFVSCRRSSALFLAAHHSGRLHLLLGLLLLLPGLHSFLGLLLLLLRTIARIYNRRKFSMITLGGSIT